MSKPSTAGSGSKIIRNFARGRRFQWNSSCDSQELSNRDFRGRYILWFRENHNWIELPSWKQSSAVLLMGSEFCFPSLFDWFFEMCLESSTRTRLGDFYDFGNKTLISPLPWLPASGLMLDFVHGFLFSVHKFLPRMTNLHWRVTVSWLRRFSQSTYVDHWTLRLIKSETKHRH